MSKPFFVELRDTQNAHWNRSKMGFSDLNLTDGQPKVLYILKAYEGCVQRELAELCDVKPSSMTLLLEGLIKKDLVTRESMVNQNGKRVYRIYLTPKGHGIADKLYELMDTIEEECFRGISEDEKKLLLSLLARVKENLYQARRK